LTAARDAVAKGDLGGALASLLSAWSDHPAPAIADAIGAVGARAAAAHKPPTAKTEAERNALWIKLAKAGDPAIRGVLIASLPDARGFAVTLQRIDALVKQLPDPRISSRLCDFIEVPIYNASVARTLPFWKRLFDLLPKLGDPRVLDRAQGMIARW